MAASGCRRWNHGGGCAHRLIVGAAAVVAVLLLGACASTPPTPLTVNTEPELLLPQIALFHKRPSEELLAHCKRFDADSMLNTCSLNSIPGDLFVEQLQASEFFGEVAYGKQEFDYSLLLTTAMLNEESVGDISKAALAGATLLVVPVTMEQPVTVELVLLWRGFPVHQMRFDLPLVQTMSLFRDPLQGQRAFAAQVVSRFIEEARAEAIFSPSFLSRKLQSEDYAGTLGHPQQVLDYRVIDTSIPNDPLAGAQLVYQRRLFDFDVFTVSIYPVRRTEWSDAEAVLREEISGLREEFEAGEKEGYWSAVRIGELEALQLQIGAVAAPGLRQSVFATDDGATPQILRTWLLLHEDKFVRVVNVVPQVYQGPPREEVVQALLAGITVPGESPFMARVRDNLRSKQEQP
jgi:hypothetical protein